MRIKCFSLYLWSRGRKQVLAVSALEPLKPQILAELIRVQSVILSSKAESMSGALVVLHCEKAHTHHIVRWMNISCFFLLLLFELSASVGPRSNWQYPRPPWPHQDHRYSALQPTFQSTLQFVWPQNHTRHIFGRSFQSHFANRAITVGRWPRGSTTTAQTMSQKCFKCKLNFFYSQFLTAQGPGWQRRRHGYGFKNKNKKTLYPRCFCHVSLPRMKNFS